MPETKKGRKIHAAMRRQYGKKAGDRVFYASANKGSIKGVHVKKRKARAMHRGAKRRKRR